MYMANGHNRSSSDPKWKITKDIVDKRDKRSCRFERCISAKEYNQLIQGSPKTLDRAHIFAASAHPELLYNPNNVITLRRFIHRRMDDFTNPLNGESISLQEHWYWWYRIYTHKIIKFDENTDYELLMIQEIK